MSERVNPKVSFVLAVLLLFAGRTAFAGRIIYVDAAATGANNGSSWANACKRLQDALAAASAGDEIRVAWGLYKPDQGAGITAGDRAATFRLKNDVAVKGGYAGFGQVRPDDRDIDLSQTILSGDLNGDDGPEFANNAENSYHVVTGSDTDGSAVLDGFVVTAGNADKQSQPDCERGGGMYNCNGSPTLINCTFSGNRVNSDGGGVCNFDNSSPMITNCVFKGNSCASGGGMSNILDSSPAIINCTFTDNHAAYSGGGLKNHGLSSPTLTNCRIIGNTAGVVGVFYGYGGGMYNRDDCNPVLINCIITGNSAKGDSSGGGGGGIHFLNTKLNSRLTLINCTFAGNSAPRGKCLSCDSRDRSFPTNVQIANCILWDDYNQIWNYDSSAIKITYSDVRGGWPGIGNIKADPLFADADGVDNIFGTADDNLRLLPNSPCIDVGDSSALPQLVLQDLDGNRRVMNSVIDMGAYEFRAPLNLYVDGVHGDNDSDGLTPETAFATIQKAIDAAEDGDTILVYPDVYEEEINFLAKAITVGGVATADGVPVLENPGDFAVSFYSGEGPDSVLKNFVIKNSFMAVFIAGSSPTISNVTVVGNKYGIEAFVGSEPDISSSIFWSNTAGDLFGCRARYSCIERADTGQGNISADPLFADPVNGDYHLLSERGRYWPEHDIWVLDELTSPCVDAGDPNTDLLDEPIPNGGRINMGAYGGTAYASMSEMVWLDGDINRDGVVDMVDFAMLAENWLKDELPHRTYRP